MTDNNRRSTGVAWLVAAGSVLLGAPIDPDAFGEGPPADDVQGGQPHGSDDEGRSGP